MKNSPLHLPNATLCLLIRKHGTAISEICLAKKKRGFGVGRWNGVGGKVETLRRESIEQAADREAHEEIQIQVLERTKVAVLEFFFPHKPQQNQRVHVFLVSRWNGDPQETEEMQPQWFSISDLPFDHMWPDDRYWLPDVLKGNFVTATFTFGPNDQVTKQTIGSRPRTGLNPVQGSTR